MRKGRTRHRTRSPVVDALASCARRLQDQDRTYAVGDDVRVPVQTALGVAVVATVLARQVPNDERLVATSREKHVRAMRAVLAAAVGRLRGSP